MNRALTDIPRIFTPKALGMGDAGHMSQSQGRKYGGVWGGGSPPQRNDPVGLKLSAVGLKIMCLFTRGALQSKLNIFETRRPIRLKLLSWKFAQTESSSSEIIW
jgi:hypothetical protein